MQDKSHKPRRDTPEGQHPTRQLLLLLASECGVFFFASCLFAETLVTGGWTNNLAALLLLGLVVPLPIYIVAFAAKCWHEKTVSPYLALVSIALSLVLVNPCVSGVVAHSLSPSLEGMVRRCEELMRIISYL
jgi:hypothetical protein